MPLAIWSETWRDRAMIFSKSKLNALDREAQGVGLLQPIVELSALQQGLARDTAPVQAGASGTFHLHTGNFFAQLARPDGGRVAGGSAADDDQIKFR